MSGRNQDRSEAAQISDTQLDDALSLLNPSDDLDIAKIRHHLRAHANAFSMLRHIGNILPTVHEDMAKMRQISSALEIVQSNLNDLHVQNLTLLHLAFPEQSDRNSTLEDILSELGVLKSMAESFGCAKIPRKTKDEALRHAVGGLMLILHKVTGKMPKVRGRDSYAETEPQLVSPEAKVIGLLLRVGQPGLLDTTLVNIIRELRRLTLDELQKQYSHQLIVGLSVHPIEVKILEEPSN